MRIILFVIFGFIPCILRAQLGIEFGPTFQQPTENPFETEKDKAEREANTLLANRIENIYLAYGYTTQLKFDTKDPIQNISLGSAVVKHVVDGDQNTIDLYPAVQEGQTNMNVTIKGVTYVFILHIVSDQRVMYRRTFTFPLTETAAVPKVSGPPLKPQDIDVVFYISAIERAQKDPNYFKAMQKSMKSVPLDTVYTWNGCPIYLIAAVQFPQDNLVVLKIQWQNLTDTALYLDSTQYRVFIANTPVPVTASSQLASTLFPGQMDTTYLFIQGYGLNADNAFELMLPPEAAGVKKILEGIAR